MLASEQQPIEVASSGGLQAADFTVENCVLRSDDARDFLCELRPGFQTKTRGDRTARTCPAGASECGISTSADALSIYGWPRSVECAANVVCSVIQLSRSDRRNYSNDTRNSSSSSSPGNTGRSPLALNAATPARCAPVSLAARDTLDQRFARALLSKRVERHAEIRVKVAFIPAPFESLGRRRHDDAWTHVYVVARHPHAEFRSQKILGFDRRSQEPGIPDVSGHHRRVERVLQVAFDAHMVQRVARLQLHTSAEPTEMPAVSDASEKRPRSDRSELVPIGARTRESLTRLFDDHESPNGVAKDSTAGAPNRRHRDVPTVVAKARTGICVSHHGALHGGLL